LSNYESPDFKDRLNSAAKARRAILEKFRSAPGSDDPAVVERQAARRSIIAAREKRTAERETARKAREAEIAAESERAAKAAAETERETAERAAREAAEQTERDAALKAEQKAARDVRYAARKAAKKERRRGY
jgi:hypothetical protein